MEYAVVKIAGESDIMGRVVSLDEDNIVLAHPMYVIVRQSMATKGLSMVMQRATMLAENHELELDLEQVIGYYYPAPEVVDYYQEVVYAHTSMYDGMFRKQMTGEDFQEESSEILDKLSEYLTKSSSNTVFH